MIEKMTDPDWGSLNKFFKKEEFDCPDATGSGNEMSKEFVKWLYNMRSVLGFPIVISKGGGYRTTEYQEKHGGTKGKESDHTQGMGVDVKCADSSQRYAIFDYCIRNGIKRLEICDRHVHIGYSMTLPQNVLIWGKSK